MKGKVSVVVTCYNHEEFIEECLRSIFAQTYSNIELLVINDGSTDNSGDVIQRVLEDSPFAKTEYIFQKNKGICATRNRTFEWVSGEFLLFVDSDNALTTNYIEMLHIGLARNDADIAYGNLMNMDTNEIFMQSKEFNITSYFAGNYIDNCSLIRVSVIKDARYDMELNRKKLEDYEFFLNLIVLKGALPHYESEVFLNYRVTQTSISQRGNEKFHFEIYLYIMRKYSLFKPVETFAGLSSNLFILENRLSDLTAHLKKLELYIQTLRNDNVSLNNQMNELHRLLNQKESDIKKQTRDMEIQDDYRKSLENQIQQLRNSTSFRLGNLIIRPLKMVGKLIKHPGLIKIYCGKIFRKIRSRFIKNTSLKGLLLRPIRFVERRHNIYSNPNRVLIFVIFEKKSHLQSYKQIFLKELAKNVSKTLIIVNGALPQADLDMLSEIGEVKLRENSGYDTAAFKFGIKYIGQEGLSKFDELILANDTSVGPVTNLANVFDRMATRKLDFWGISYGEAQSDFTETNPYKYIPIHLQSYFLVIEKDLLANRNFYRYWDNLVDTNSRRKAIGKHETVFTKYFADLGFIHGALLPEIGDSAMYIHPMTMLTEGSPLIKYTAFSNYNSELFSWQGLDRKSEVPELVNYLKNETEYPNEVIDEIMADAEQNNENRFVLIIDGVENIIPQCTRYRVLNKAEQLENLGYNVIHVDRTKFKLEDARNAFFVIIYRSGVTPELEQLCRLCNEFGKPIFFDIDDLVVDTKYTDTLLYTQNLTAKDKADYDGGVSSYGRMMNLCDGVITSTGKMKAELLSYKSTVLLNRNVVGEELIQLSNKAEVEKVQSGKIRIGFFSGSITHNENFQMIKPALIKILTQYKNVELHLVGYLDIPKDLKIFESQIKQHKYVEWQELPKLISKVDINLAPLVKSIFNEAKSEIKWIEAALVHVPTVASNIGSFQEMIESGVTGILSEDNQWYESLKELIVSKEKREALANNAYNKVIENCTTSNHKDEFTNFISKLEKK